MRTLAVLLFCSLSPCSGADSWLTYSRTFDILRDGYVGTGSIAAVAVDSAGNTYLAGSTQNGSLATTPGVVQSSFGGGICYTYSGPWMAPGPPFLCEDVFVIKLDGEGRVVFTTYLGSAGRDLLHSMAVDPSGNIYLAGTTTLGAGTFVQGAAFGNATGGAFVVKLSPDGKSIFYSLLVPAIWWNVSIATDLSGNAYFAGTGASGFPFTAGAIQGRGNIVVGKLNPQGTRLIYGAQLGGSSTEYVNDIAVDNAGNVYLTGITRSTDFPVTAGAFQSTTPAELDTAFLTKLNNAGNGLVYSTYLGNAGLREGTRIRIDAAGNAYVLGSSNGTPGTQGALQPVLARGLPGFLAKLNPAGGLVFATHLSGALGQTYNPEPAHTKQGDIAIDSSGNLYAAVSSVAGLQTSPGAAQPCYGGGDSDTALIELNPEGALTGLTYLGGTGRDYPTALATATDGTVVVAGATDSPATVPTIDNAPYTAAGFVTRLHLISPTPTNSVCASQSYPYFRIGDGTGKSMVVRITKPEAIQKARDILAGRSGHTIMTAKVVKSPSFYNDQDLLFHVDPNTVDFVDMAAEVCDASIGIVNSSLADVGGAMLPFQRWCPWGTQVLAEVGTPYAENGHAFHTSAADYTEIAVAPGSIVSAFGSGFTTNNAVSFHDHTQQIWSAQILYSSPTQINYIVPGNAAPGAAEVTIYDGTGNVLREKLDVKPLAPSLFSVESGVALGWITRFHTDGSASTEALSQTPVDLGPASDRVYLSLLGTGIRNAPENITVTVGAAGARQPDWAGPQPTLPGVDQINILLPHTLAGVGKAQVIVFSKHSGLTLQSEPVQITFR